MSVLGSARPLCRTCSEVDNCAHSVPLSVKRAGLNPLGFWWRNVKASCVEIRRFIGIGEPVL